MRQRMLLFSLGLLAASTWALAAAIEVALVPMAQLMRSELEVVGRVEAVESRREGIDTHWSFRLSVERWVRADGVDRERPLWVHAFSRRPRSGTADTRGHTAGFGGTNGLPRMGDAVRVHATASDGEWKVVLPNGFQPARPLVALVAADDEYRSEDTMALFAEWIERECEARTALVLAADPQSRQPDFRSKVANTGLEPLRDARVAVLYLRYSKDPQLAATLDRLTRDGRNVVGLRTSTHAFAFEQESALSALNDGFGERVFGTPWRWHHGHGSGTRLLPPEPESAEHPILRGVGALLAERPAVPSWLYVVEPLPADCRVLLWGETLDPGASAHPQRRQPILWVRESDGKDAPRRMAYTSLGHPGDLSHPAVRRMLLQMVAWALGEEDRIPREGLSPTLDRPYEPPPTR